MSVGKNEALLKELGFVSEDSHRDVLVLTHPIEPALKLVAYDGAGRMNYLDMFTELGTQPMNIPGEPRNICIRVQNHNDVFAGAVIRTVVEQFRDLSA